MRKIRIFELSIAGAVLRFYAMMVSVVVLSFFGFFNLAAIIGFAIAVSFILGVSFKKEEKKSVTAKTILRDTFGERDVLGRVA